MNSELFLKEMGGVGVKKNIPFVFVLLVHYGKLQLPGREIKPTRRVCRT